MDYSVFASMLKQALAARSPPGCVGLYAALKTILPCYIPKVG